MTTYRKVRDALIEQRGADVACIVCGGLTQIATMSDHGGRCYPCYTEHCRRAPEPVPRSRYAERIRAEIVAMGKRVAE